MKTWIRKTVPYCVIRLTLFVVLFGYCKCCNQALRAYKDGDVMLGGLFSLHMASNDNQRGEFSAKEFGRAEALIFAIDSVNKNSSLLPNVSIGYDIRNYCDRRALAMQAAYDFKRNSDPICMHKWNSSMSANSSYTKWAGSKAISALIGPYNSASAVLVASLLQVDDIPAISSTTTSEELSSQFYKDFFRTAPSDKWVAKAIADIIERFNWTYVAVVGLDDSFGRSGILALERESLNRTFCIAFYELIPRLDYQDNMERTVARIKKHRTIGVIIVWLYGKYLEKFFIVATENGLQGKTLILSDGSTIEETFLLDPRFSILNGSLVIDLYDYPFPAFEEHVKNITSAKSAEHDVKWWREFWRSQFNCSMGKSIDLGIAPCKRNLTQGHALSKLRSSFVSYLIDAVYAIAYALDSIYRCTTEQGFRNEGRPCPLANPTIKGRDLQKYLRNVSFDGLTGKVRFNRFGDPLSASYSIMNFQPSSAIGAHLRKVMVGTWNKDSTPELKINTSLLRWKTMSTPVSFCSTKCLPGTKREITTPCCWDCVNCPQGTISAEIGSTRCSVCEPETKPNDGSTRCENLPILNVTLKTAAGITITVVASTVFILTLLVCGTYINFYDTPIVKASNKEVSFLLLFGISGLLILAVLDVSEPSDFLCTAATFWRYFTLNLCVTVLFTKTMRITSVFEIDKVAQLFTPCYKTLARQTIFVSVVNAVPISLLILWVFTDTPGCEKIIRSDEYIFLVCKHYYTNTGFALFIAVSFYILTVALLCTYYSFKARGIPENFNETKYIGFSMYILLLSSIVYYPVVFTFDSWYVTLVSCLTTLVSASGLLGCMFVPKVYILLFRPQQNTMEYVRSQVLRFSFGSVAEARVFPKPVNTGISNPALEPENGRACTSKL